MRSPVGVTAARRATCRQSPKPACPNRLQQQVPVVLRCRDSYPGATPSISANGTSNAILGAAENANPAVLHPYDARSLATELYNQPGIERLRSFRSGKQIHYTHDREWESLRRNDDRGRRIRALVARMFEVGYTYGWRHEEVLALRVRQINLLAARLGSNREQQKTSMDAKYR